MGRLQTCFRFSDSALTRKKCLADTFSPLSTGWQVQERTNGRPLSMRTSPTASGSSIIGTLPDGSPAVSQDIGNAVMLTRAFYKSGNGGPMPDAQAR
ncbi:MAG: hypothetical protein MK102_14960 [Fuerstiella sp.]|nr:hypothetical protein [Fuerstiella sp.]